MAKDGDTANPRPVLLTLEGDTEQYFKLLPDRPLGRATLVASDIPIDRESDVVMQNGGVYSFFVKVLTIYCSIYLFCNNSNIAKNKVYCFSFIEKKYIMINLLILIF